MCVTILPGNSRWLRLDWFASWGFLGAGDALNRRCCGSRCNRCYRTAGQLVAKAFRYGDPFIAQPVARRGTCAGVRSASGGAVILPGLHNAVAFFFFILGVGCARACNRQRHGAGKQDIQSLLGNHKFLP